MLTVIVLCLLLKTSTTMTTTTSDADEGSGSDFPTESTGSESTTETQSTPVPEQCNNSPNVTIINITSEGFTVLWDKIPDALSYNLNITNMGPRYEIPDFCIKTNQEISQVFDNNGTENQIRYEFTNASPYYKYTINVVTICNTNNLVVEKRKSTKATFPGAPTDLSYDSKTRSIIWKPPCAINDQRLDEFQLSIYGFYSENVSNIDSRTLNVTVGSTINNSYFKNLQPLIPSSKYSVTIVASSSQGKSEPSKISFTTPSEKPGMPKIEDPERIGAKSYEIKWEPPTEACGKIENYNILVQFLKRNYSNTACIEDSHPNTNDTLPGNQNTNIFRAQESNSLYKISVSASTSAGPGNDSVKNFSTELIQSESMSEKDLNHEISELFQHYNRTVTITILKPPCTYSDPNGYIYKYTAISTRISTRNYSTISDQKEISAKSATFALKPKYNYSFKVVAKAPIQADFIKFEFATESGYPSINDDAIINTAITNETRKAYFILDKTMFNETDGEIEYYSLILFHGNSDFNEHFGEWIKTNWPHVPGEGVELTKSFWNPFRNEIVGDEISSYPIVVKNGSHDLKPGTKYKLVVRVLTENTWINFNCAEFTTLTDPEDNLALPLGLFFGLCLALLLAAFLFMRYRKQIKQTSIFARPSAASSTSKRSTPSPIPCKKLLNGYDPCQNEETLRHQFQDIIARIKEMHFDVTFAHLPENMRKNRYTNISPYDHSRVKLNIDEDDDLASDYINASYIRGYSGRVEYIATQGPLEGTCKDFWMMILQEKVTTIVMVSQFIEQNKQKCFMYFPNNAQVESYGGDIQVKCLTELHFGTCMVRNLQVSKDAVTKTVTHMQFLDWPDFSVPDNTSYMLDFCKRIRDTVYFQEGLVLVHCSAGVGRTGTLIATDILLQTIRDHRDVNVYKTVLELRKQRANMVQTVKQYIFIHACLKDSMEVAIALGGFHEPLYKNFNHLNYPDNVDDNLPPTIVAESRF